MERAQNHASVEEILKEIRSDTRTGATELTRKAAQCLEAFSCDGHSSLNVYADQLVSLGRALIDSQPTMASLFNLVNRILLETETARRAGSVEALQHSLREAIQRYFESADSAQEKIARHGD